MDLVRLKRYIEEVNCQSEALRLLKDLKINWETDIKKMDFSGLSSGVSMSGKPKIIYEKPYKDIFQLDGKMVDLIHFVAKTNNKIIPPFKVHYYNIQGKQRILGDFSGYVDGFHRVQLAVKLNLESIPVLLWEKERYIFEPNETEFVINENCLIVKNSRGKILYEFDFSKKEVETILLNSLTNKIEMVVYDI
ncbi:MAG: hypothetical protein QM305_09715 [Bacteroidota bacterium]|nr:hypothetical protein [Bacteroidota bacterium]